MYASSTERSATQTIYSGPQIDRNAFRYILSGNLLFYLFAGLYIVRVLCCHPPRACKPPTHRPFHRTSVADRPLRPDGPHLPPHVATHVPGSSAVPREAWRARAASGSGRPDPGGRRRGAGDSGRGPPQVGRLTALPALGLPGHGALVQGGRLGGMGVVGVVLEIEGYRAEWTCSGMFFQKETEQS